MSPPFLYNPKNVKILYIEHLYQSALASHRTFEYFPMDSVKSPEDVVTVDVASANQLLTSGHLYLDVRTREDYNNGHVTNALNVPYMFLTPQGRVKNPDFLSQVSSICKKEDHLVVGCNIGGRALRACVDLLNEGYEHVTRMGGGYNAWRDHNESTKNETKGVA